MIRNLVLMLGAALALSACAGLSPQADLLSQKGIITLRTTYQASCGSLIPLHDAGAVTGATFNRVKAQCVTIGHNLDTIEVMMATARLADARALANSVQSANQEVWDSTHKPPS